MWTLFIFCSHFHTLCKIYLLCRKECLSYEIGSMLVDTPENMAYVITIFYIGISFCKFLILFLIELKCEIDNVPLSPLFVVVSSTKKSNISVNSKSSQICQEFLRKSTLQVCKLI